MERKCDICNKTYTTRKVDLDRGWGLCCSKSCASLKRERKKGNTKWYPHNRQEGEQSDGDYASELNEMGWDGHKNSF